MNQRLKRELPLHLMLIAPLVVIFIFSYVPMAGIIIAFQRFIPARGLFGDQRSVGFENFTYVFQLPSVVRAEEHHRHRVPEDRVRSAHADRVRYRLANYRVF